MDDTYGHQVGDKYLRKTAKLLESFASKYDGSAYRIGGDEFLVYIPQEMPENTLKIYCEELLELKKGNNLISKQPYILQFSVGAASTNNGDIETNDLYGAADKALYRVKESGKGIYGIASKETMETIRYEKNLEARISKAIDNDEFYPRYIPRYSMIWIDDKLQKEIVGIEVDASWFDNDGKPLKSIDFVPYVDKMNKTTELDRIILQKTLNELPEAIRLCNFDDRYEKVSVYSGKSTILGNEFGKIVSQINNTSINYDSLLEVGVPGAKAHLNNIRLHTEIGKEFENRLELTISDIEESYDAIEDYVKLLGEDKISSLVLDLRNDNIMSLEKEKRTSIVSSIQKLAHISKANFNITGVTNLEDVKELSTNLHVTVFQGDGLCEPLVLEELLEEISKCTGTSELEGTSK